MYNTTYSLTGNTYNNKEMIKDLGGRWNAAERCWVIVGSLLDNTLFSLRARGVRVATS